MKIKIKNQPTKKNPKYPKYHSTLYNRANNWAQATRPKTIGSMNSLFRQYYKASGGRIYLPGWKQFMEANAIPAFRHAGRDIYKKFKQIQDSINSTTDKQHRENCEIYANDLMTTKTFNGFNIQAHIAKALSAKYSVPWEFSDEGGESKGIDIYLGDIPISIKPITYRKEDINENISVPIIYYREYKDYVKIMNCHILEDILDNRRTVVPD